MNADWYMGYFYPGNNNMHVSSINYEQMLCSLCSVVLFIFLKDVTGNLLMAEKRPQTPPQS